MKKIAIIMGSDSDLKIMQAAIDIIKEFTVEYHVEIVSAHRTPEGMVDFAKKAHQNYAVIIAGAGGSAHLPGMVASLTTLPVIGVPINSSNSIAGVDSLLSIVQMPNGIPVATVAINGAKNAGLLALRILGLNHQAISEKLTSYQDSLKEKVIQMNHRLKS